MRARRSFTKRRASSSRTQPRPEAVVVGERV
jgi:hypothetical protein